MSFGEAVRSVYSKYSTFEGRASRSEYWWFALFYFLVVLAVYLVIGLIFVVTRSFTLGYVGVIALFLFAIATLIPSLAVLVRRLHDTDHSGWWFWISLVPFVGGIILLVFLILPSTPGYNRYGPPPGQPSAEQWAQYAGQTRADALRSFAEDAAKAAAAGFQPVWQQWRWQGGIEILDVAYARRPPDPPWSYRPPGSPA